VTVTSASNKDVKSTGAANALLDFLRTSPAVGAIKAAGMTPAP